MTAVFRTLFVAVWALLALGSAHAALFGDDDARRAILELRQRVDANQSALAATEQRLAAENAQLRRSLLELQSQIDGQRGEAASGKGREEELTRAVADLQRANKDLQQGLEERLRRVEAGRSANPEAVGDQGAAPAERADFDSALAVFRKGDFAAAQAGFSDFTRKHPRSSLLPMALFWLGNSQYATRDYQNAVLNFRAMLATAPDHPRASEAALAIANSQIELKEVRGARRTLEDLIKVYPQTPAATAASERLATLR
ncbi:MAG: tol-pal system protein YbgF [Burkholderiaceae bacterium]